LGLLNAGGFYDDLLRFIDRCRDGGFLWPDVQELLLVDQSVGPLLDRLYAEAQRLKATPPSPDEQAAGGVLPGI
ncbi:MAG: hypothetical protein V4532_10005, partial [Pseudomonadota bacterium]